MNYVSSKSNTLDQQEDLVGTDPLADFLLRFSVTNLHTLSEQKFAASLHKEPVVLPIAFHAATYPFPVEPDLQRTSRGQGNGGQGWPTCFADTIAAVSALAPNNPHQPPLCPPRCSPLPPLS